MKQPAQCGGFFIRKSYQLCRIPCMKYGVLILCVLINGKSALAVPEINPDMTFPEIVEQLEAEGAWRFRGAYHLPWNDMPDIDVDAWLAAPEPEWIPHGYHAYFHLADKTCLSIRVEKHPDSQPETVRGFELGLPGQGYPGKFQWFEEGDKGLHTYPRQIDLAKHKGLFRWRRNAIIALLGGLLLLAIVKRKQQRMGQHLRSSRN